MSAVQDILYFTTTKIKKFLCQEVKITVLESQ